MDEMIDAINKCESLFGKSSKGCFKRELIWDNSQKIIPL